MLLLPLALSPDALVGIVGITFFPFGFTFPQPLLYFSFPMIGQIHRWNAFVCLLLGFCFNSVLIWLLLFRSIKEMRSYSRILLQTAVVNLLLSLANALV
ncbi:hypothetical protein niasHT_011231 [Heterodera trifolii]|uniref:Integral membrane protein n=1 Tax=Heterodera trifolii TaxID=157864 RepID=A0ABD2L6P7_9BILA